MAGRGRPRRRTKGWTGGTPSGIPEKLRQKIFERDNWTCQLQYPDRCIGLTPGSAVLQVDHIRNLASLGLPRGHNDEDNLAAVCIPCHRKKTSNEGLAAQGKLNPKRETRSIAAQMADNFDYSKVLNASQRPRDNSRAEAAREEGERLRRLAAELDDD
ncbi:HNH endonuclease signature motif containing protein [Mycolicibacterium sp. GESEQ-9]|uniref:HNH endonuclease n=1 Tax=unclassified Mycolicibacterium TaxID=2636767 RepID=UPI001B3382DC